MRIGFVDFDLANFHADTFLRLLREKHSKVVEVAGVWGMQEASSKAWAEKNGAPWIASPSELAQSMDTVMILSPDHANHHLSLAREVFPHIERAYIDKTFAPSGAEARAIARLADETGTRFFSSSALRFAPKLVEFMSHDKHLNAVDVEMKGPNNWTTYGIHVVEPVITLFGPEVARVRANSSEHVLRVDVEWTDGRTGHLSVNHVAPQRFEMRVSSAKRLDVLDLSDPRYYENLLCAVVQFFHSGLAPVQEEETLAVMDVLEAVIQSTKTDSWVNLRPR